MSKFDNRSQGDLFARSEDPIQHIQNNGLDVSYQPSAICEELANQWFAALLEDVHWKQDVVTVYGKEHLTPRLSCWMGESWMSYSYSNTTMRPVPWQAFVQQIKQQVEEVSGEQFNSVLINYYRNGQDSNGWHSDDEPELGPEPLIASLSLGATRDFYLREKKHYANKLSFSLEHGSLLVMRGKTQSHWQHHVPKRATAGPRINLTFRTIRFDGAGNAPKLT